MTERQQETSLLEKLAMEHLDKELFVILTDFKLDPMTFAALTAQCIGRFIAILDTQIQEKPHTMKQWYDLEAMKEEGRSFPPDICHNTFKANIQDARKQYREHELPRQKEFHRSPDKAHLREALKKVMDAKTPGDMIAAMEAFTRSRHGKRDG